MQILNYCARVFLIGEWVGGYSTIFKVFAPPDVNEGLYTTPFTAINARLEYVERKSLPFAEMSATDTS
jgi:hypothetical protein